MIQGDDSALVADLRADVEVLAGEIGERNLFRSEGLDAALHHLEERLRGAGLQPARQSFQAVGVPCHNLEVEIPGPGGQGEAVVIGAHYDTVPDSPGANDNGSGVAGVLALARAFARRRAVERTLRFVFFANEEPPFFATDQMGSRIYARRSAERGERIRAMLSLETIGYFTDAPGSQRYPAPPLRWLYPDAGDPHYHLPSDTPEKLDYRRMAGVVRGLERVVEVLGSG